MPEVHKQRLAVIISSNAYKDREEEIITQKALEEYVDSNWKDDSFIGSNPLLMWHDGDPIGDIVFADMQGAFLIEVARERTNAVVNLATKGDDPLQVEISQVWDEMEKYQDLLGASVGFHYIKEDREDGIYETILKNETSLLPLTRAANVFTKVYIVQENNNE